MEFIDFVLNKPKLKTFVEEKLKDYEGMNYQSKMKLIKDVLTEMFQEKKDENDENGQTYQLKTFLDTLSNKTQLIFSLLNYVSSETMRKFITVVWVTVNQVFYHQF